MLGILSSLGDPIKIIMNFFVLSDSYNAAWWFLQTYIILVLISPLMFTLVKKYSSLMILTISGIIYFLSYVQRIKHVIDLSHHPLLNMIATAVVLFGTSQLPFIAGAIFAKDKIYTLFPKKLSYFSIRTHYALQELFFLSFYMPIFKQYLSLLLPV